jgi:hypothetical protein
MKYWVVIEVNCAGNNGKVIYVTTNSTSPYTNTSLTCFWNSANTTWTTSLTAPIYLSIYGPNATYVNENLPLPNYVQHAYRMFAGDSINGPINMLPFAIDRFIDDPSQLPMDRFAVTRVINGSQIVLFRPPALSVPFWSLEFKTKGPKLMADNDISPIPSEFRYVIEDKVILRFWSMGYGQQDSNLAQMFNNDIADFLKSMRREYLPHPSKGFRVNRGGGVSMLPLPLDLPNRTFMMTNVPTYYRTTTSGV